jgi:hypothetical protein
MDPIHTQGSLHESSKCSYGRKCFVGFGIPEGSYVRITTTNISTFSTLGMTVQDVQLLTHPNVVLLYLGVADQTNQNLMMS